jgi:hypothetical protein
MMNEVFCDEDKKIILAIFNLIPIANIKIN